MMMRLNEVSLKEVPKFVKLIETSIPASGKKSANAKDIIDDVFNVSVERGLNEKECSMLLHLFLTSTLSSSDKFKLLQNLVPEDKLPAADIRSFMTWFISNFRRLDSFSLSTSSHVLQWIIGLLEYNRVDSEEIHNFYDDFFTMLEYPSLIPYVAKLLCKLTTPDDVTGQTVRTIYFYGDLNNKYILTVLNVFKGYKPHLMLEEVKKVDVVSVLNSVPQTMDSVMRVRAICTRRPQMAPGTVGVCEVLTRNTSYFKEEFNKISSLIPLPSYNFEGMDKLAACYPNSIEEACQHFSRVPIPQKILSLLHNDAGFFTIMYQGIEVQMRFQNSLLQTLQNALIYQELKASSEDVEFLLRRLHCFQTFMHQGIPCVSVFVSGYLMNWDGVDYRYSILKLIEWASFHSFRALWSNILRPLHIQFVTNNINMKKEIIQVLTNLIRNMFADLSRVQRGVAFPFLKRGPKWTKEPETMLEPLIAWTQNLITLGLAVEPDSSPLLMEAIHFYKMVNTVEAASGLKMFTVVSEEVVLQSLLSQNPNTILRICGLLLRYHQEFLPQLRTQQPHFYKQCRAKISLTSNYAQQIIYFLQNGQVLTPRKENRMIMSHVLNESLAARRESISLDLHLYFVSSYVIFESKKNFLNLAHPNDKRTSLELATVHLREIKEFINFFSPSVE